MNRASKNLDFVVGTFMKTWQVSWDKKCVSCPALQQVFIL